MQYQILCQRCAPTNLQLPDFWSSDAPKQPALFPCIHRLRLPDCDRIAFRVNKTGINPAWMDLRVNGYIPFGTETNQLSRSITGSPFLGSNGLLLNQRITTESATRAIPARATPTPL